MCQHHHQAQDDRPPLNPPSDDFPWHLGVFDAHCHPTDTMSSVTSLASMRASVLTIMATRSQDQRLVAEVAFSHGVQEPVLPSPSPSPTSSEGSGSAGCKVVPSFGWHPWFSYQLYDDSAAESTYKPIANNDDEDEEASKVSKAAHYQAVLSPAPKDDSFISFLPTPTPMSSFLSATRKHLESFPHALVGEVGLDKAFRLPRQWDPSDASPRDDSLTPGGREGRLLSPYRVRMSHQQAILQAQLRLAGEVGRPVSVHGVQAHGVLYDTISALWKGHELRVLSRREKKMVAPGAEDVDSESDNDDDENNETLPRQKQKKKQPTGGKPFPQRICLHSYSGSSDMLKQWVHPAVPSKVFVSFSTAVNLSTEGGKTKLADVIRAVPDDRILVESDLHIAGEDMEAALEDMYRIVCEIKGWNVEDGVKKIGQNYNDFIFG